MKVKNIIHKYVVIIPTKINIHLIYALEGNGEFCSPGLNVYGDEVELRIEIKGKTHHFLTERIKCFVT